MKQINSTQITNPFLYTYTLNGQYDVLTIPNALTRDFNYDDQSRLTSVISTQPPTGNIADFSYAYDLDNYTLQNTMLGQRSSVTSATKKTKYYYDGNYQLNRTDYPTGAPFNGAIHSWTYDPIGNRLTNTVNGTPQNYTYYLNDGNPNNGQRLQSDGTKTYTYDYNGNMISDGTNSYTWDKDNRLTGITGSLTATYKYDYLGRRFSKTINGGTPSTYIYDGQNLIAERGAATVDYVFGPGIDEPLAMVSGANQYVYSVDGLGSAAAMTTTTGTISRTYTYDAWGIIASQTGSIANPFTYTARESAEVGLRYYRARYYNPNIGRFVSEDRLRFTAGTNFYVYTLNHPSANTDPSGLDAVTSDSNALACFKQAWQEAGYGFKCYEVGFWIIKTEKICKLCPIEKTYEYSKITIPSRPPGANCIAHTHPTRGSHGCRPRAGTPSGPDKELAKAADPDICIYVIGHEGIFKYDPGTNQTTREEGPDWTTKASGECKPNCPK